MDLGVALFASGCQRGNGETVQGGYPLYSPRRSREEYTTRVVPPLYPPRVHQSHHHQSAQHWLPVHPRWVNGEECLGSTERKSLGMRRGELSSPRCCEEERELCAEVSQIFGIEQTRDRIDSGESFLKTLRTA